MARYRSKPTEVIAIQWTGDNVIQCKLFWEDRVRMITENLEILSGVDGATGWIQVPVGHWLVKTDANNDLWPVENEHFTSKYDEVKPWPKEIEDEIS